MSISLPERIQQATAQSLDSYSRIVIAFSGGLDSSVLLHACSQIKSQSKEQGYDFLAVHINHQLSDNADSWAEHCSEIAQELGIGFEVQTVAIDRNQASLEAAARSARYKALDTFLNQPESVLVTAHHANDQAETLLLRLARGSGLSGLRGIHAQRKQSSADLARPLLEFSRKQLEEYATFYSLRWVEDESNANLEFDRNFLRKKIIPELETRWPDIVSSLGVVANQASEQTALLDQLAEQDLELAFLRDYRFGPCFNLSLFEQWGVARAKNLMRFWLASVLPEYLIFAKCTEKNRTGFNRQQWRQFEALCERPESLAKIRVQLNGIEVELRAYDQKLFICPVERLELLLTEHRQIVENSPRASSKPVSVLGSLKIATVSSGSQENEKNKILNSDHLDSLQLTRASVFDSIRLNGHQQQLKKLFQLNRVPHWLRADYPVLVDKQILVAIPGVAVADSYKFDSDNKSCTKSDQAVVVDWSFDLDGRLLNS